MRIETVCGPGERRGREVFGVCEEMVERLASDVIDLAGSSTPLFCGEVATPSSALAAPLNSAPGRVSSGKRRFQYRPGSVSRTANRDAPSNTARWCRYSQAILSRKLLCGTRSSVMSRPL
jgi:hypothetical protein